MPMLMPKERLVNLLLLLHLIKKANEEGVIEGLTKFQKLVFLSELEMIKQGHKGLSYTFIRLNYGAYSGQAKNDLEELQRNNLVTISTSRGIFLTERGNEVLDAASDLFEANVEILEDIQTICEEYAAVPWRVVMALVYKMPHPLGRKKTIKAAEMRQVLLPPISKKKTKHTFQIDPQWAESLEILLDTEFYESLKKAAREVREKRLLTHEEVFGSM